MTDPDKTVLKIGELASRAGLTVRALHHYDSIGLLKPSARADSGYRLYNRADVARLQQIQALRRFGLPLAGIGDLLARPDAPFGEVVAQQIAALDRQIEQASALRGQLGQLQRQLDHGDEPALADWLATLELMTLYDKYFTPEELARLPFFQPDARRERDWAGLVAGVRALMDRGVAVDQPEPQQRALRWMAQLERDTAANPDFALRMSAMVELEPSARQRTGITPALKQYVVDAMAAFKLARYAQYLNEDELNRMREHGSGHGKEWLAVIAAVHQQMAAGAAPGDPAVQDLARQWFALFRLRVGDDPATLAKLRRAHDAEPALLSGTWVNEAMLDFVRRAAATLPA